MKKITVELEELRKKKLFLATPMYGGQCFGQYTLSLVNTIAKAKDLGVGVTPYFIYNESLIQRARNYCVEAFLQSDCTHLVFVDADIHWKQDELFMMLNECGPENDKLILCGPYPKKEISWEKITRAVQQGAANENPGELKNYVGDYVFNTQDTYVLDFESEFKVDEAGTGFMMIHRSAFERIRNKFPKKVYRPDHLRSEDFNGSKEIYLYFDCKIDTKTKRYLSEDYYFCHLARRAGIDVWMAPWVGLTHTGTFEFGGSLAHLASVGSHATGGDYKQVNSEV